MARCATCKSDDRNECGCDQSCVDCGENVYLRGECEWPEGKVRCWGCAHDRIQKLEKQIQQIKKRT